MKLKRREMTEAVPRREMTLFDEMDRLFDTMTNRGWMRPWRDMWPDWTGSNLMGLEQEAIITPRVDVIDRESEILVRAEVPGVTKDNLQVEMAGDLLTITGERKHAEEKEEGAFYRSEIVRGSFSRTIRLPAEVSLDDTRADFHDGVLEIHLPKTQKTERRRIEVKSAA